MQIAKQLKKSVSLAYYRYELTTALYMLDFWEKCIFNSFVLLGFALFLYTSINYMPETVQEWVRATTEYFPTTLGPLLETAIGAIAPPVMVEL
ncbi:hypothetical protein H9P43_000521 [Blastocladiella emersonii ATCC 22665]|nr:hypothetical protein H9P43_000521 [Blastocladiella emersonii ATCC 22665]